MTNNYDTPPMFLTETAQALLSSAARIVDECECANRCKLYAPGRSCLDCASFSPAANGYLVCDSYEQAGEAVA